MYMLHTYYLYRCITYHDLTCKCTPVLTDDRLFRHVEHCFPRSFGSADVGTGGVLVVFGLCIGTAGMLFIRCQNCKKSSGHGCTHVRTHRVHTTPLHVL